MSHIPEWLRAHMNESQLAKIEESIRKAELSTDGEIVPMIVQGSGHRGSIPIVLFFAVYASLMTVEPFLHAYLVDIGLSLSLFVPLAMIVSAVLAYTLGGSVWLYRQLTPNSLKAFYVEQRAQAEFYKRGLDKTENATGVLLFISMAEHQAIVLADQGIADKVDEDTWTKTLDDLLGAFKASNYIGGLERAIESIGKILSPHFPKTPGNQNELKNHLIIGD